MFVGIEIGGTKLQLGVGAGDGGLAGLWRSSVDVAAGPEGIRRQIIAAVPQLLARAGVDRGRVRGVGIGFGGPVDDATHTIVKSHQIEGWDGFPLASWITDLLGWPAALGNDADVAGLAEALFGAARGLSPVFYITVGSGVGGGLIVDGVIYRGCGRGAAEIGHLPLGMPGAGDDPQPGNVESLASGWGMERQARAALAELGPLARSSSLLQKAAAGGPVTVPLIAAAARQGDQLAQAVLQLGFRALSTGICQVIALLCPRRFVIGGGVSLIGEEQFFRPLRRMVAEGVFRPFAGRYDIVPASLGEESVVHGALAVARRQFGP